MKKILITMMAIAFSLSAYSETRTIYVLDEYKSSPQATEALITVWCVNAKVFVESSKGGVTQILASSDGSGLTCHQYKRGMK